MPNQPREGTSVRTMRLDDDLWAQVQSAAGELGVSASEVVRVALSEYLSRRAS